MEQLCGIAGCSIDGRGTCSFLGSAHDLDLDHPWRCRLGELAGWSRPTRACTGTAGWYGACELSGMRHMLRAT